MGNSSASGVSSTSGTGVTSGNVVNTGVASPLKALVSAELAVVLGPIDKFLTALQQPEVNKEAVVQQFVALQLAELEQAPLIESVGIGGLAGAAQTQLHSLVNKFSSSVAKA